VIDHFGINCADYARSQQFYDRVLGALGYSRQLDFGEAIGYGRDGKPVFWIAAFVRDPDGNNVEAVCHA
jgi:catechol 2,3-dioxygenase-like lactoylglutathione lyase family enzyme